LTCGGCRYGFAIGNVAAFDMADPNAIVSPGGVGFDINCGVRLLRTNLHYDVRARLPPLDSAHHMAGCPQDVKPVQERLTQSLFDHIPVSARPLALQGVALAEFACATQVGVGSTGVIPTTSQMLTEALEMGMDWSVREVRPACSLAVWLRSARRSTGAGAFSLALVPHFSSARRRAIPGQRTRSIARNTAACSTRTR
jgi:hypothetical protein